MNVYEEGKKNEKRLNFDHENWQNDENLFQSVVGKSWNNNNVKLESVIYLCFVFLFGLQVTRLI